MSSLKQIKNSWYFVSKSILICSVLWIQSCSDDDAETLNIDSQITFANITPAMSVWNNVPISLEVSDEKGIASVQVLVDGVALAMLTDPPFSVSWDASSTTDGVHTIKVVVADKSGNKTEKTTTVTVQNTLVSINIAADQLYMGEDSDERGFVFLSDENGKVIASTEYTNGNDVVLKSSTFTGTKFFLTEVLTVVDNEYDEVRMWTFAEIERGQTWTVLDDRDSDETYAGTANIALTNGVNDAIYELASNGDYTSFYTLDGSPSVRIRTAPSKLYVHRLDNENLPVAYGMFPNIIVGDNTINLNQVNKTITKSTTALPEGTTSAFVELKGYLALNNYTEPYRLGSFVRHDDNLALNVFYPGIEFPSYTAEIGYDTDDVEYYGGRNSPVFQFTDIPSTVSFSFANEKLTYSASGDFDFVATTFVSESEETFWSFILPEGTGKVIPSFEIPDELKTFETVVFGSPTAYSVYAFDDIDGYDDLKTFIRSSSVSIDALFEDGLIYTEITRAITAPGGRSKPSKKYSLRTTLKR